MHVDRPDDPGNAVALDYTFHEILLQSSTQMLFLTPPLEQARVDWISAFHQHVAIACTLPRLSSSRFQVFASSHASEGPKDYANTLLLLPPETLPSVFGLIEEKLAAAHEHVQHWLQYQALWDIASSSVLLDRLGRDLDQWQRCLVEITQARSGIDRPDEEVSFGPIIINHRQVQHKINSKYDSWQKEAQSQFGSILNDTIRTTHATLIAHKQRLEGIYLDGAIKDVIVGVEFLLTMKTDLAGIQTQVHSLESSEKLLLKQRYQFPLDWLHVTNVTGVLNDVGQVLDRRLAAMDAQLPSLQSKIREEDHANRLRVDELLLAWEAQRPAQGGLVALEVLDTLSSFASQVAKLTEEVAHIQGAKQALGLEGSATIDHRLSFVSREISDLKGVWILIAPVYEQLDAMRVVQLKSINPTKIRKQLEELADRLRSLPAMARSYAAVEWIQEALAQRLAVQPVLRDLCTEALKDRHWKGLLLALGLSGSCSSVTAVTLGHIWDCRPLTHKAAVVDALATAQGELALEQFLRDLRDHWVSAELSFVVRDNVRLVVGWDVLFTSLEDNLNSLASLKQSPYFRSVPEFQEDTSNWESRLMNLRGIFEIWVEVQRKWVYLRGIFRNADIKAQLPIQFSKFKGVDNEYLSVVKRVTVKPLVLELLQIGNMAKQLERQDATMTVIQKALGDYLEKQRQLFPRFYFINNDELVEVIGNSTEPTKILPHMGKLFAGITTLALSPDQSMSVTANEDTALVVGEGAEEHEHAYAMCSKEGETVRFASPLVLSVGVKEWLGALEQLMRTTLEEMVGKALLAMSTATSSGSTHSQEETEGGLLSWIDASAAQVVLLATQLAWVQHVELALNNNDSKSGLTTALASLESRLRTLSGSVLNDLPWQLRRKCEHLLTDMVHQRDVVRSLVDKAVLHKNDFAWVYHLRFYWTPTVSKGVAGGNLQVQMANARFEYGFEYQGVADRLVQTPLTDRCYLTLTQALHARMGANPFGPAGTGKTETVKMLGAQLGRFVLVFNCDKSFDYASMGRIFAGLCQVGAWGCFDEFNRLEERILSAVSQQILTIQRGLLAQQESIELLGAPCKLRPDVGIFVTLNPGYAGRSNLPDNLKQLFRAVAMVVPDRKMIAQVMLFSQGIVTAEALAGKVELLFTLCAEQLSSQAHYDFGLRALKSVLMGAGDLKRQQAVSEPDPTGADIVDECVEDRERLVVIQSICDSLLPKLVPADLPLFTALLQAVFPGCQLPGGGDEALVAAIEKVCEEEGLEASSAWVAKVLQLKQVLDMRHGVMVVGPSGTGKTTTWRVLLKALAKLEHSKHEHFVIDPKSVRKDKLYGALDPMTLEWTDGVFTKILRKIATESSNSGGGSGSGASGSGGVRARQSRQWIIFDGDVDPEWAENLNSVLDDNKILTLPTGDRLKLPPSVRIIMEVDSLKHATMATVSRCGMVWFAEGTVSLEVLLRYQLQQLRRHRFDLDAVTATTMMTDASSSSSGSSNSDGNKLVEETQRHFVDALTPHFCDSGLVAITMLSSLSQPHIMDVTLGRLVTTLYSLLLRGLTLLVEHNESHSDFPIASANTVEKYASKWLLHSVLWACGGSMSADQRATMGDMLMGFGFTEPLPSGCRLVDVQVTINESNHWLPWSSSVPTIELEAHRVTSVDIVIPTIDTLRHVEVVRAFLNTHQPLILCGPPGSGKTMTLTAVLEASTEFIFAPLNFSSSTTPELILQTFAQYCEVIDSPDGLVLLPNKACYQSHQWLVVFCDEVNLPECDGYGSQRVTMFLRQLTEQGGYWNTDCKWVTLRRVQFVGACNPPSDMGRVPLPGT